MEIKWNKVEDLPLDSEMYRKMLILVEGRLNSNNLYVLTDYWKVFYYNEDYNFPQGTDLKKQIEENKWAYGSFSRGIKFSKVKGWMYESDMVELYNNQQNT